MEIMGVNVVHIVADGGEGEGGILVVERVDVLEAKGKGRLGKVV